MNLIRVVEAHIHSNPFLRFEDEPETLDCNFIHVHTIDLPVSTFSSLFLLTCLVTGEDDQKS